jgi:hypothetical protein
MQLKVRCLVRDTSYEFQGRPSIDISLQNSPLAFLKRVGRIFRTRIVHELTKQGYYSLYMLGKSGDSKHNISVGHSSTGGECETWHYADEK